MERRTDRTPSRGLRMLSGDVRGILVAVDFALRSICRLRKRWRQFYAVVSSIECKQVVRKFGLIELLTNIKEFQYQEAQLECKQVVRKFGLIELLTNIKEFQYQEAQLGA